MVSLVVVAQRYIMREKITLIATTIREPHLRWLVAWCRGCWWWWHAHIINIYECVYRQLAINFAIELWPIYSDKQLIGMRIRNEFQFFRSLFLSRSIGRSVSRSCAIDRKSISTSYSVEWHIYTEWATVLCDLSSNIGNILIFIIIVNNWWAHVWRRRVLKTQGERGHE